MKTVRFSKKLVSVLAVLCLLASVALPAGLLTRAEADDPTVTAIHYATDTSANYKWVDGYYDSADYSSEHLYEVSFEYYLPEDAVVEWENIGSSALTVTGDYTFRQGYHTVDVSCNSTRSDGALYLRFINSAKNTDLYIWNFKVICNGSEVTKRNYSPATNVTSDTSKTLSQYSWSATMDAVMVTEITFPQNPGKTFSNFHPALDYNIYYGANDAATALTISFDYYLPADVSGDLYIRSIAGDTTTVGGAQQLEKTKGIHAASWTVWSSAADGSLTGKLLPVVTAAVGTEMYLWNWSVTRNDQAVDATNNYTPSGMTYGTVGQALSTYEWYDGMENWVGDPTNPFVTAVDMSAGTKWYIGEYRDYEGTQDEYALDIYEYADGELAAAILEKLGDLPYKAYDIQLVHDDAFVEELEKDIFLAIALPEGFNSDTAKVYYCDAYGNLIDTAAYVDGGYLLLQYSVLGTFIVVDGEVADAGIVVDGDPDASGEPTDGDEPADTQSDDNKDDESGNGWIQWVAIGGGVVLLAAAAVIVLLVLKKKRSA